MDISKLPKLSKTNENLPPATPIPAESISPPEPPTAGIQYLHPTVIIAHPPGVGADAWFNTIIGLICVFMGKTFASYLIARAMGHPFHTGVNWVEGDRAGQEVSYPELQSHQMLTDAGIFLFGLAVLVEVGVKALVSLQVRVPPIVAACAFVLALITTAVNVYACCKFLADGTVPLMSGLAAAFGGYIVADSWRVLARSRAEISIPGIVSP